MLVEMGPDRLHHAFWRFYDPNHPDYVPGTPLEQAFRDYYRYLDSEVGSLIEGLGDDTAVMVVSDHGAQAMYGGIQINEWLMQNGYLTLVDPPSEPTPIGRCTIDWPRTRVWADGGYYSRIFLNVEGREPRGRRRAGRLRAAARRADREARGARRRAGPTRSAPACSGPRTCTRRSNGVAARPDRLLRQPAAGARSARSATAASRCARTTPAPTTPTTPSTASPSSPGRACPTAVPRRRPPVRHRADGADGARPAGAGRHAGPEPGLTPLIDPAALLDELRVLAYEGRAYADDRVRPGPLRADVRRSWTSSTPSSPACRRPRWASGSRPTWARRRRRSARPR